MTQVDPTIIIFEDCIIGFSFIVVYTLQDARYTSVLIETGIFVKECRQIDNTQVFSMVAVRILRVFRPSASRRRRPMKGSQTA